VVVGKARFLIKSVTTNPFYFFISKIFHIFVVLKGTTWDTKMTKEKMNTCSVGSPQTPTQMSSTPHQEVTLFGQKQNGKQYQKLTENANNGKKRIPNHGNSVSIPTTVVYQRPSKNPWNSIRHYIT
jgi:hypothetical protein